MKILPGMSDLTRPYWEAAREGRLVAQRCDACGNLQHPPMPRCGACHADTLSWQSLTGLGTVYTYTVVQHAAHQALVDRIPYAVGIVELDEGVRVVTDFPDDPLAVRIGDRVQAVFQPASDDIVLPHFVPAEGAEHGADRPFAR